MFNSQLNTANEVNISPEVATRLRGDDKANYIRTLFDNISTRYDFIITLIFLGHTSLWYRQALSDLDLKAGDKVLDVGCGTGESTRYLINRYPGINIEGMDLSSGMLNEARRLSPALTYFEGDVCAIPCPNSTYDFVLTTFTFRNFPDRNLAIAEMLRVLRPGESPSNTRSFLSQKLCSNQIFHNPHIRRTKIELAITKLATQYRRLINANQ